jgi:hypothetical protein
VSDDFVRVVLLPRFTALVGARTFTTRPVAVGRFGSISVSGWRGVALGGGSPSVTMYVETSNDLSTWTTDATLSLSEDAELRGCEQTSSLTPKRASEAVDSIS